MKKSVLLFALLAVAVDVRAQLVEHYDNPQRLFDIQGRTVMEAAPMTESATLDLGTLRPAVYILKLTTAEGPQTLKIVKQQ